MRGEEIVALLPRLRKAAAGVRWNRVDIDDLVQHAALCLLTATPVNPLVFARSRMRDYIRQHGWHRTNRTRKARRVTLSEAEWLDLEEAVVGEGVVDWDELRLTPQQEAVGRLVADHGLSQEEAGRRLGLRQIDVSHIWRRVVERVAEKWGEV